MTQRDLDYWTRQQELADQEMSNFELPATALERMIYNLSVKVDVFQRQIEELRGDAKLGEQYRKHLEICSMGAVPFEEPK